MIKFTWKSSKGISIKNQAIIQMNHIIISKFIHWHYNAVFGNTCFFVNCIKFFGRTKNTYILSFGCINSKHRSSAVRLVIYSFFQKIN